MTAYIVLKIGIIVSIWSERAVNYRTTYDLAAKATRYVIYVPSYGLV